MQRCLGAGKRIASAFNQSSLEMSIQQMNELETRRRASGIDSSCSVGTFLLRMFAICSTIKGDWFESIQSTDGFGTESF